MLRRKKVDYGANGNSIFVYPTSGDQHQIYDLNIGLSVHCYKLYLKVVRENEYWLSAI
jgi:hypothetical protein